MGDGDDRVYYLYFLLAGISLGLCGCSILERPGCQKPAVLGVADNSLLPREPVSSEPHKGHEGGVCRFGGLIKVRLTAATVHGEVLNPVC